MAVAEAALGPLMDVWVQYQNYQDFRKALTELSGLCLSSVVSHKLLYAVAVVRAASLRRLRVADGGQARGEA